MDIVSKYWDKRILTNDPLTAVLTLDAPACLNEAYDKWERYSLFSSIKTSLKNKKVLDVGCGYGRICLDFAQQGANVTALDISESMLNLLKKNISTLTLNNKITTVQERSYNFQLNTKFDIILCFGLLEHLSPKKRDETIINCISHLKRAGYLFIIINNSMNPFLRDFYRKKSRKIKGYNSNLIGLKWLEKFCDLYKMKYDIVASNPNYSILHYFFHKNRRFNENTLIQLSLNALKADMLSDSYDNFAETYASHFIVKISR